MKFLLDSSLAMGHVHSLNETFSPAHTFTHVREKFGPTAKDEEWLRDLAREGDWIVLSGDYRIGKSAHERAVWQTTGLLLFFLSKGWANIPPVEQQSRLAAALPRIIEKASTANPGSAYSIALNGRLTRVYP